MVGIATIGISAILSTISCRGVDSADSISPAIDTTQLAAPGPRARIADSEQSTLLDRTSEFQRVILSDNLVTLSEYERAYLSFTQCITEGGYKFDKEPTLTALMDFDYRIIYPIEDVERGRSVHEACRVEFTQEVELAWSHKDFAGEADIINEAQKRMVACAREAGIEMSEYEDFRSLRQERSEDFYTCLFLVQEQMNLPGWGG
jgi:hypothetical protein